MIEALASGLLQIVDEAAAELRSVSEDRHLAHVIRHVPAAALDVCCRIGEGESVTLRFLIEDYLRHLRHHLSQIAERRRDGRVASGARSVTPGDAGTGPEIDGLAAGFVECALPREAWTHAAHLTVGMW